MVVAAAVAEAAAVVAAAVAVVVAVLAAEPAKRYNPSRTASLSQTSSISNFNRPVGNPAVHGITSKAAVLVALVAAAAVGLLPSIA